MAHGASPSRRKNGNEGRPLLLPYAVLRRAMRGERRGTEQHTLYIPLKLPLDSARPAPWTARGYSFSCLKCRMRNDE
jgi:hypothetical protein